MRRKEAHPCETRAKVVPVVAVPDEEADEHARVHAGDGHASDPVVVEGAEGRVRIGIGEKGVQRAPRDVFPVALAERAMSGRVGDDGRDVDQRNGGLRVVWVDVEERVALGGEKVVRRRWTAAGDADRLRQSKQCLRRESALHRTRSLMHAP